MSILNLHISVSLCHAHAAASAAREVGDSVSYREEDGKLGPGGRQIIIVVVFIFFTLPSGL